jgi:hypothetical protein
LLVNGEILRSQTTTPNIAQPVNLSTRMLVQTGDYVGIGGFTIGGPLSKHLLLRAMGPSLTQIGVPNVVANPALELHDSSGDTLAINNDWRDTQQIAIQATGMPPGNDREAAIDITLAPGAYTAIVQSEDGESGLALFEIYDLNPSSDAKLANLSSRAVVTPGDNTLIAGFTISGEGTDAIVVRGLGPSLAAAGLLEGALMDPVLQLRDSNGVLVADNDDWSKGSIYQATAIFGTGLQPLDKKESAIAAILPPGSYTALLNGSNETSGVGVIEVYNLNWNVSKPSVEAAIVSRLQTGTVTNIEAQHVTLNGSPDTFRLVFSLPLVINQSGIGSRAALKGITAPISINASAADIQSAIVAVRGFYAYAQTGNHELIAGNFSYFADTGALNRDPIVTGSAKDGFTIYYGSTVGSPTAYNTWVAGLPLVSVAVP